MFKQLPLNKREIGDKQEAFALSVLKQAGIEVIEQNYQCKLGEIDIIAKDKGGLIFVEVRYRKSKFYGGSLESVDRKKQRRISLTANHYLQKHQLTNKIACRFDVFAITGNLNQLSYQWIEAAFEAS